MELEYLRPAIIEPDGKTPEEWFRIGIACLDGHAGWKDYEQAAFCFKQAAMLGHPKASSQLKILKQDNKGVVFADHSMTIKVLSFSSNNNGANQPREAPRIAFECNLDRCPTCGAMVFRKHPHPWGGFVCAREENGCGERLYIPITEAGLRRGLAIQPYKEQTKPVIYSYFGRCVHEVKYNKELADDIKRALLDEAIRRIHECCVIENLLKGCSDRSLVVTPAPYSRYRKLQPVRYVTKGIAEGRLEYSELLWKKSGVESKGRVRGTELAEGDITCKYPMGGRSILIIDDTYGEGATLRACIKALKVSGAGDIFFLSLCRNMFGGMKGQR